MENSTRKKKRVLIFGSSLVVVIAVVGFFAYLATTPLSPQEAARQYIEDHYDSVAESVVEAAFREHSLKTEIVAEIGESFAEQVVPYSCGVKDDWASSGADCQLSFNTQKPIEVEIVAPVKVHLRRVTGPFGQSGASAHASDIVMDGLVLNAPALEQLEKVADVAAETAETVEKVEEALDSLRGINPLGN